MWGKVGFFCTSRIQRESKQSINGILSFIQSWSLTKRQGELSSRSLTLGEPASAVTLWVLRKDNSNAREHNTVRVSNGPENIGYMHEKTLGVSKTYIFCLKYTFSNVLRKCGRQNADLPLS